MLKLAVFFREHCTLHMQLSAVSLADRDSEIAELIAGEIAVVRAYLTAWRGAGGLEAGTEINVQQHLRDVAAQRVLAWPQISKDPIEEYADGRLVNTFPLTFPTGCGDLRQSRLRTDFSALDWCQHVFRHCDGRALSSFRGQRAVWACFNSAVRSMSHRTGGLVHKQVGSSVLRESELTSFVSARSDLISEIFAFGADLPSTPMQWKLAGLDVEWIVRQMSWLPPWTDTGKDSI